MHASWSVVGSFWRGRFVYFRALMQHYPAFLRALALGAIINIAVADALASAFRL